MIVAVLQPYFFPYLGYFQLMAQCHKFVLLDDVQYVDRRWMNRNRILSNGAPSWFTYPVARGAQTATIKDRFYVGTAKAKANLLNKIREAYRRAPHCDEVGELVRCCLNCGASSVAEVNAHLLTEVARRMNISCEFLVASDLDIHPAARGQARILAICRQLGATEYVNPIGGLSLYSAENLRKKASD